MEIPAIEHKQQEGDKLNQLLDMMRGIKKQQTEIKLEIHKIRDEQTRFNDKIKAMKQENSK